MKRILVIDDYQFFLLDIILPETSGIDLLKWMINENKMNQKKVIMLSSVEESHVLAECFQFGAYDDVSIPIDQEVFLASIGSLAAGMAHEINNPLRFMISKFSILDSNTVRTI